MEKNIIISNNALNSIVNDIKSILYKTRENAYASINQNILYSNWQIGRRIVEEEQMVKNVQIMVPNCLMHSLNNSSQKLERNIMYETCGITSNSIFLFLIGKL